MFHNSKRKRAETALIGSVLPYALSGFLHQVGSSVGRRWWDMHVRLGPRIIPSFFTDVISSLSPSSLS